MRSYCGQSPIHVTNVRLNDNYMVIGDVNYDLLSAITNTRDK